MGQLFCKDCCHLGNSGDGTKKGGAFITWGADTTLQQQQQHDDDYYSGDHYDISASTDGYDDDDNKQAKQRAARLKKRNVALHAEFRDRFHATSIGASSQSAASSSVASGENMAYNVAASKNNNISNNNAAADNSDIDILAPPLCNTKIMVATDNVFCGVEDGVDTLLLQSPSRDSSSSFDSGSNYYSRSGAVLPQDNQSNKEAAASRATKKKPPPPPPPRTFPKTPEEETFITSALTDTDTNFILDGIPPHLRQTLMSQMERITIPSHHLLIRKGDYPPDYLYLLYKGTIGVYIDPGECMEDENMIDIKMNHSNSSSALNKMSTKNSMSPTSGGGGSSVSGSLGSNSIKRNVFRQSYVLNLRKSLFQSTTFTNDYNPNNSNNILGQVISLVRGSFSMPGGGGGGGGTNLMRLVHLPRPH